MKYIPEKSSLKQHKVPEWFHDAKFGIFIHWGLYSVPAFAITGIDLVQSMKRGIEQHFKNNPYAEWYLNSLRIEGSPTQEYHNQSFGKNFSYDDFVPIFNKEIEKWNPDEMADLFKKIGARYVVLGTKHHDGFLLWPSAHQNPNKKNYHASRNIVGELTKAVKDRGLKMGFYYSGALDWSFNPNPIKDGISFVTNGPTSIEYTEYANNHWYELIDKFEPIELWNDIGYPPNTNVYEIFAYFYNKFPKGVVNDRWKQLQKSEIKHPTVRYWDFTTPEYEKMPKITNYKWESSRGIGNSYGYNQMENENDYLTSKELIHLLIDIVSKNGNLLLNVGPKADGSIPDLQKKAILGIGEWLEMNGEAIFETRPWIRADGETEDKIPIRFTQKGETLYIHLLTDFIGPEVVINDLRITENAKLELLGNEELLKWQAKDESLQVFIPSDLKRSSAYVLKVKPKPD
ncbi:MAG: alpha-L-fucosidase [Candidatus Thorarchaeota archaeon]